MHCYTRERKTTIFSFKPHIFAFNVAIKLSIGRRNKLVTDTLDRVVRGPSKLLPPVMATKLHFNVRNSLGKEVPGE